jgi:predicted tellurium resistance membrane protein TerC
VAAVLALLTNPAAWAALVTLIVMEVVLGIDNLLFISIMSNKLPVAQRARARRIGIGLALVMRLALLGTLSWLIGLNATVLTVLGQAFTWRELILLGGGLFLVWKATTEIHHALDPVDKVAAAAAGPLQLTMTAAVAQILVLDLVFSIDSILTAVGMTDQLPIMVIAVVFAVTVMLFAANPLANFIAANPTIVMLALGFLLMIGMVLIAEGFGAHIPKGYLYAAMAFSAGVEGLNMAARKRRR